MEFEVAFQRRYRLKTMILSKQCYWSYIAFLTQLKLPSKQVLLFTLNHRLNVFLRFQSHGIFGSSLVLLLLYLFTLFRRRWSRHTMTSPLRTSSTCRSSCRCSLPLRRCSRFLPPTPSGWLGSGKHPTSPWYVIHSSRVCSRAHSFIYPFVY